MEHANAGGPSCNKYFSIYCQGELGWLLHLSPAMLLASVASQCHDWKHCPLCTSYAGPWLAEHVDLRARLATKSMDTDSLRHLTLELQNRILACGRTQPAPQVNLVAPLLAPEQLRAVVRVLCYLCVLIACCILSLTVILARHISSCARVLLAPSH